MYTYNNRPTEAFCIKSSPEIHENIKDFCKENKIPIYEGTNGREYNDEYPYIAWDGEEITGREEPSSYEEISFQDFIAKFQSEIINS